VSLSKARQESDSLRKRVKAGIDPLAEREAVKAARDAELARAKKQERLEAATFRLVAEKYICSKEAEWRNSKHRQQWRNTLATYAHPEIGDLAVCEITTDHILKILQPHWLTKTETASRVQSRIENVLDYAKSMRLRDGDNPARWRGHLDTILASPSKVQKVRHQRSLPYSEAPALAAAAWQSDAPAARALLLALLCAARTSEVIESEWREFDLDAKEWRIPARRMKAGKEQRIPLSDAAVSVVRAQLSVRRNQWVFPSPQALKNKPISNMAMSKWLDRNGWREKTTVHGLRTTMTEWAEAETEYPQRLIDIALAHQLSDKAQKAYFRGDLMEKRRSMMNDWAQFLEVRPEGSAGADGLPDGR
jgi:integrase